jgi:hypothetical protein
MGRTRTFLGLVLIVIGTILLSRALMQPLMPPPPPMAAMPPLPAMPAMPPMPAMPAMPPLPALPPMPAIPRLAALPPVPHHAPFFHWGAWFSPPVLILALLLAVFWLRRRGTHERPLA